MDHASRAVASPSAEVPGPVHVGLPADIGNEVVAGAASTATMPFGLPAAPPPAERLEALDTLLRRAKRPLLVAGLSCTRLADRVAWQQVVARHQLPVVLSPMAKGLLSETHPAYVGGLFHALSALVAETIQEADLVLALGYDPVEFNVEEWLPDVPFVHVDTAPADVDTSVQLAVEAVGDVGAALQFLAEQPPYEHTWDLEAIAVRRQRLFDTLMAPSPSLSPACVIGAIQDVLSSDEGYLTCDVGAHTHLIGQLWRTPGPGKLLMTNGWSSMGFGIPAAIAAKLCRPEHPVVCVTGDGGFLMMAGEMATAARLGLPVVVVVLVDRHIQLITVKQERQGAQRYGTQLYPSGYTSPEHYFGVPVVVARSVDEVREAVVQGLRGSAPLVVEALVDPATYDEVILRPHKLG